MLADARVLTKCFLTTDKNVVLGDLFANSDFEKAFLIVEAPRGPSSRSKFKVVDIYQLRRWRNN